MQQNENAAVADCVVDVGAIAEQQEARERRVGMGPPLLSRCPAAAYVRPVAAVKTLYSDFVVRECCPTYRHGEPLRLELTAVDAATPQPERGAKRTRDGAADVATASAALAAQVASLLTPQDAVRLTAAVADGEDRVELTGDYDKAQRTAVHTCVRAVLGHTHVSGTDPTTGRIFVTTANAADRRAQRRRARPREEPSFLHFTLYKENLDSNHVLRQLARMLRIPTQRLLFSGTKDKRAVTLQRVAVRNLHPSHVATLPEQCAALKSQGRVQVCGFTQESCGLRLGDAVGNHFSIALRLWPGTRCPSAAELAVAEAHLRTVGAVNYYGTQRFGTTHVLTSDVGIALLQGHFASALELLFESKARLVPAMRPVTAHVAARDYAAALELTPHYCLQERDLLRHLVQNPTDLQGAFRVLPRTLAMLHFHAVQSLLWNTMATRRLAEADRRAVEVGDLVLESTYRRICNARTTTTQMDNEPHNATELECDDDDGKVVLPAVHVLSAEDDLAAFALADVVLPVPGPDADLQYPRSAGCTRADYVTAMHALGIGDALLVANKALVKVYHYHGTYRALCVRPERLTLRACRTTAWRTPVFMTDYERYEQHPECDDGAAAVDLTPLVADDAGEVEVLAASFTLPPGSYATCVLRELAVCSGEEFHPAEASE